MSLRAYVLHKKSHNFTRYVLTTGDSWRWHFDTVLKTFLPDFAEPLNINEFTTHANQGKIDIVIHTSCDYNWRERLPKSAIEALENNHHMHVICVQHELENLSVRDRDAWKKVVDQKRFSLLTLSTHTSRELSRHVMKWEYETGDSAWRNVNVDTLIPVSGGNPSDCGIDLHRVLMIDLSCRPRRTQQARQVSRFIVAQGKCRRDSLSAGDLGQCHTVAAQLPGSHRSSSRGHQRLVRFHLFAHSIGRRLILADPAAWGYKLDITSGKYTAAADSERPAVTLHLVGNKPDSVEIQIPAEIDGVVNLHSALEYDEFYTLIATMYVSIHTQQLTNAYNRDLILPAFVNFVYVDHKLSSAIPTGIISRVPILSTPLLLEAYSFLRSPALVLHPSSMSEIEAVRLLRARQDPMAGEDVVLPGYKPYQGSASRFEWDRYHQRLYDANARVMKNLLQHTRLREFVQSGGVRAEDEVTMDKGRSAGA